MTSARIKRIAALNTRLSIAAAELHCAIRDGGRDLEPAALCRLQSAERTITEELTAIRERLRLEIEADPQEGRTR